MHAPKHGPRFWLGNGILALAMAAIFFMNTLWAYLGQGALLLWMVLAGLGMYFLMTDKGGEPPLSD
ncbi:MAG: hypothetical protein AB1697_05450 [Pseudomonadota bacterium]